MKECEDCKYGVMVDHINPAESVIGCHSPSKINSAAGRAQERNHDLDCFYYVRKWWKFWAEW